jgi:hypothetical protein
LWIHSAQSKIIVIHSEYETRQHKLVKAKYGTYYYDCEGKMFVEKIDQQMYTLVDVEATPACYIVKQRQASINKMQKPKQEIKQTHTLQEFIKSSDPHNLLNNTIISEETKLWEQNHVKLTFCSDGGVRTGIAGYGIIASTDTQICIKKSPDITGHVRRVYITPE